MPPIYFDVGELKVHNIIECVISMHECCHPTVVVLRGHIQ